MFEQGQPTKLNDEVVERLAKKFNISLDAKSSTSEENLATVSISGKCVQHTGFCPNPSCPTNHRYEVEGRTMLLPDREKADPVGGRFCAFCGEILERKCPACGAPVHTGAICSFCGETYIPFEKT